MKTSQKGIELLNKYKTLLDKNNVTTYLRKAHFLAQIHHESNLIPQRENLNYSADGLKKVFNRHFTDLEAIKYARNPEMIANKVYANKYGNGNEMSGDGWKYRGGGFIQITFKDNYQEMSEDTGIDYVNNPELLENEADAMISALWYWNKRKLNIYADADNIYAVTKRINGGFNGIEDRKKLLNEYKYLLTK